MSGEPVLQMEQC